ncbi:ankyrin repeat-containing domain protein [Nemania serpens]|nr:ankyrin repeat-containing domain protein [Nemania serpens]
MADQPRSDNITNHAELEDSENVELDTDINETDHISLLGSKADSNAQNQDEQLLISRVAEADDVKLSELLWKHLAIKGPVNTSGPLIALMAVLKASAKKDELVNIDVLAKGHDGCTALHLAAIIGIPDAVKALIKAGIDVNSRDDRGWTPLIYAALYNQYDSIKVLLEFKADVNIRDNTYGQSAVSYAAEKGHTQVIKLLIEAHSDIYSKNGEGFPPLK